jgi:hypothetical protein
MQNGIGEALYIWSVSRQARERGCKPDLLVISTYLKDLLVPVT